VRTSPNRGIPLARNRALEEARGRYIAWLDSDDICHPERLAEQREFLDRNPNVDMVGSAARKIDGSGRLLTGGRVSVRSHEEIRALLLFRSAFQQSSIFGRADAIRSVPYDLAFPVCEDVDMFTRFTEEHRAANLPLFLIARRIHAGQTIRSNVERILERQMAISARLLTRLELNFTQDELRNHVILGGSFDNRISDALVDWAEGWFARIIAANGKQRRYEPQALRSCFDLVLMKAALRRFAKQPRNVGRLIGRALRHPSGTGALVRDAALPLIPLKGRPSAAGLRPLIGA
jgi:glycosyltransferase involved in cell wall biosynthesis